MRSWFIAGVMLAALGGSAQAQSTILVVTSLDVSSVTTGGTPVVALQPGHRPHGGWIHNPSVATVNLCINEKGTASGTTSAGDTTCIVPGQTYILAASNNAVSVVSSDSAHAFSGYGF